MPAAIPFLLAMAQSGAADAKSDVLRRLDGARRRVALEHSSLGSYCMGRKMRAEAEREFRRALLLDPANIEANLGVGNRQQNGLWVPAPPRKEPVRDEAPPEEAKKHIQLIAQKRAALQKKAVTEFGEVGKFALTVGLDAEAKTAFAHVVDYDPDHDLANAALGRVRSGNGWIPADEVGEADRIAARVASAPRGEPFEETTFIESKTGWKLNKVRTAHFEFEGMIPLDDLQKLVQVAETARAEWYELIGKKAPVLKQPVAGCFVDSVQDLAKFVDACIEGDDNEKKYQKSLGGVWFRHRKGMIYYKGTHDLQYLQDKAVHYLVAHVETERLCSPGTAPPWFREGVGYWLTRRIVGSASSMCVSRETGTQTRTWVSSGDWKKTLRNRIREGADIPFRSVADASLNSLTTERAVKGWSAVDFLLRTKAGQMASYFEGIAKKVHPETAFRESLEPAGYEAFDTFWRQWVLIRY